MFVIISVRTPQYRTSLSLLFLLSVLSRAAAGRPSQIHGSRGRRFALPILGPRSLVLVAFALTYASFVVLCKLLMVPFDVVRIPNTSETSL